MYKTLSIIPSFILLSIITTINTENNHELTNSNINTTKLTIGTSYNTTNNSTITYYTLPINPITSN